MDKTTIRNAFATFAVNDKITLRCTRETSSLSGDYEITEIKTGRGRAGMCKILTLKGETTFKLSTKDCGSIVSISHNGNFYGSDQETHTNKVFPTNFEMHKHLKDVVFDMALKTQQGRFDIKSDEPSFNGIFSVVSAQLKAGRWGQVVVDLKREDTGELVQLWSYRHSGIIQSVEPII